MCKKLKCVVNFAAQTIVIKILNDNIMATIECDSLFLLSYLRGRKVPGVSIPYFAQHSLNSYFGEVKLALNCLNLQCKKIFRQFVNYIFKLNAN